MDLAECAIEPARERCRRPGGLRHRSDAVLIFSTLLCTRLMPLIARAVKTRERMAKYII